MTSAVAGDTADGGLAGSGVTAKRGDSVFFFPECLFLDRVVML